MKPCKYQNNVNIIAYCELYFMQCCTAEKRGRACPFDDSLYRKQFEFVRTVGQLAYEAEKKYNRADNLKKKKK